MRRQPVERAAYRGRWISVVAVVSIVGWAAPALLMLDRGFAVEDEGSYVLSYRFWHSNPYFVSGSQYVFGPLFEALGESIPLLRLVRLVGCLGVNGWFAWAFVRWWAARSERPLPSTG
jgi:hypothetical protein